MILPGFPKPLIGGAVEPVEFVAATGNAAVTNSLSCNVPSGTAADDTMVAVVTPQYSTVSTPSGWTLAFSDTSAIPSVYVFKRTATGSEPASYTFSPSAFMYVRAQIVTLRFASGISAGAIARPSTSATVTAPSVPMSAGAYLLGIFGHPSTNVTVSTPPSGMTGLQIPTDVNAYRTFIYGESEVADPSGTRSITFNNPSSPFGILIEVHP